MNTLMKSLMIAAIGSTMVIAQEPPTPPTPPVRVRPTPSTPAERPVPSVRPAPAERPTAPTPPVRVYVEPRFDLDFKYDYKFDINVEKVQREAERAMQLAQRELERNQLQMDRELERAAREVERVNLNFNNNFNYNFSSKANSFENSKPRQGWASSDPADSLYRVAREALTRGEYRRAAQAFSDVVKKYPRSQYVLDSQYWEAFARYRSGTTDDLRAALKILDDGKAQFAAVSSRGWDSNVDVPGLRARIQGALAARGDVAAQRALRDEAAQNPNSCDREEVSVRAEALNALGQMDIATAMPVVKKVLARRDECTVELRRRALYLIGRQPGSESVDLMLDVAKNDTDAGIRREAMSWLSRTAGDKAVPMLEDILRNSSDEQQQRSAVNALGQIDTDLARKAVRAIIERKDANERVRADAINSLARDRDNRAFPSEDMAYLRSLYTRVETTRLKEAVLSTVSRIEAPENEAWLIGIAKNEQEAPSLRSQALQRLGRMQTVSFAEIGKLYEAADSRQMRQQILSALSQRKEPEALDKLVEVAKKDTDPNVRSYAIQLLARRENDPKARQAMRDLLDRP